MRRAAAQAQDRCNHFQSRVSDLADDDLRKKYDTVFVAPHDGPAATLDLANVTPYLLIIQFWCAQLASVVACLAVSLGVGDQDSGHCALRSAAAAFLTLCVTLCKPALPRELGIGPSHRAGLDKLFGALRMGSAGFLLALILETLAHSSCEGAAPLLADEAVAASHDVAEHTLFGEASHAPLPPGVQRTVHRVVEIFGSAALLLPAAHRALFPRSKNDAPVYAACVGLFALAMTSTPLPAGFGPLHLRLSLLKSGARVVRSCLFSWLYAITLLALVPLGRALHRTSCNVLAARALVSTCWILTVPLNGWALMGAGLYTLFLLALRVNEQESVVANDPPKPTSAYSVVWSGSDDEDGHSVHSDKGLLSGAPHDKLACAATTAATPPVVPSPLAAAARVATGCMPSRNSGGAGLSDRRREELAAALRGA